MILHTLLLWVGIAVSVDTQEIPDGCKQVRMIEEAVCQDKEVEECGICKTVITRDCNIIMREVWVPHRYKRCHRNTRQSEMCVEGFRRSCNVRCIMPRASSQSYILQ